MFTLNKARQKSVFSETYDPEEEEEYEQSTVYPKSDLQFKVFKELVKNKRYSTKVKYLSLIQSRLYIASLDWYKLLTAHSHFLPWDRRCQQKCSFGGVQLSATVRVCQKKYRVGSKIRANYCQN